MGREYERASVRAGRLLDAEINYLWQLHHPNFVNLIGYCSEDEHKLLAYKFMPKGSMENHLFGNEFNVVLTSELLSWKLRMKIALAAARGLAFLHILRQKTSDCLTCNFAVCAFDLQNYNAKISDFGLARDGPTDHKTHVSTRVKGTYGYTAPEHLITGLRSRAEKSHKNTTQIGPRLPTQMDYNDVPKTLTKAVHEGSETGTKKGIEPKGT
ncbi:receptor-like cytoplasmic kinase 176 [Olea europaea var. sylvestris]|uniref:receptor-like cytoplasmic kinase 176 n=1 Tax=Olea europaea var. sylvestris TaxID=158386 RepID=UPI000C1D66A4|nr:receptor-like cytoplasmic kinase 176 [Olea europaea var. sylvestris]